MADNDKRERSGLRPGVIEFQTARKRADRRHKPGSVAPGSGGSGGGGTAGSLALAAQLRPTPAPTPGRWYGEKHGGIGFRLWDIVYLFSLARQALKPAEALEWGARYFSGMMSEEHGRSVLDALAPGLEEELTAGELPDEIREAFRRAICQGAGELLNKHRFDLEEMTRAEAYRLQELLEDLYAHSHWLLPAVPLTLHRFLRKAGLLNY